MDGNNWPIPKMHVKSLNKHIVLDMIRFTPGGISRIELARKLGLTRAAVTAIINDLNEIGIVRESRTNHNGGRRPVTLELVPSQGYVVGVDMGATHVMVVVADYSSNVIKEKEISIDISRGPNVCLNQVDRLVRQVLLEAELQLSDIGSVGLGVPGPLVTEQGVVCASPIMPGWDDFPIRTTLENAWGCYVHMNNDAELGALGEWAYGVGRGQQNLAYVKVGTGIGAGLMFKSNIYQGTTGSAGEIGHITINEKGPLCTCGNHGCLEAFAGGQAVIKRAYEELSKGRRSQLIGFGDIYQITVADIISAARKGDVLSQQIIAEAGSYLGIAIASLVNLINPSMVIIGGSLSQSGDLLLNPIRSTVTNRSLPVAARLVKISASLLGKRASAMGAVVQALSYCLHKFDS